MKVAIVYETHTGITAGAAQKMAEVVRTAGHECTVSNITNADAAVLAKADAIAIGCWTKGYFIIMQHPSEGITGWLRDKHLKGKPVAVFTTYRLAIGGTLRQLSDTVENAGGKVTGMYKVKGPNVPPGFEAWVGSLASDAAI